MTLGRRPLRIFCSRGNPPRSLPVSLTRYRPCPPTTNHHQSLSFRSITTNHHHSQSIQPPTINSPNPSCALLSLTNHHCVPNQVPPRGRKCQIPWSPKPCVITGRGAARAEDAQGTPTQSYTSPSIHVYEEQRQTLTILVRE